MKTLDEIAIHFETDKASQFSRTYAKPHDYCRHLERFFEPMRDSPIKMIEVGIGSGESIRTWLEYFGHPDTMIYGLDLVHSTNPWNDPHSSPDKRYAFFTGSQSDVELWKRFTAEVCGVLNIVIDDGSHSCGDIKITFSCLWPYLKSGGIYEIEDLNFDIESKVWLQRLVGNVHVDGPGIGIDSIYFARELAILRKK